MAIKFYNNLSRQLEEFKPVKKGEVTIYSCGPTVYDVSHIGHARSALTWDILNRYLKYKGFRVRWARNITNVDDKIVNRAKELGVSPDELSRKYTYEFWDDMTKLQVSWPAYEPRATDYIPQMIDFVSELINKGFAYEVKGDVYFRVHKHKQYGQLKGLPLEDLRKGISRVEHSSAKEDDLDFALWKAFDAKTDEDKENLFLSPWGYGRPGWHLECSTMIQSLFGRESIDIHAGGDDLIFPHHENECAQSECLTDKKLANYWMHNGMVMINGKKMSKSENNYLTIKDILQKFNPNAIRYFNLTTHYKHQLNYSHEALEAASTGFASLYKSIQNNIKDDINSIDKNHPNIDQDLVAKFEAAMDDDLNTCKALALLFENKDKAETVAYLLAVLGFDFANSDADGVANGDVQGKYSAGLDAAMSLLIDIRDKSRVSKDFATSDLIRDRLAAANIKLQDLKDQPGQWEIE